MKAMADAMRAQKSERAAATAAALAAKLGSLSDEERAEYEARMQRDARSEQRKNRMLTSQLGAYGTASTRAKLGKGIKKGGSGGGAE